MRTHTQDVTAPNLLWIYPGSLTEEIYAAQHLETTRELRKLGWHVTLMASGPPEQESIRGVPVHSLAMPRVFFMGQLIFHLKVYLHLLHLPTDPDVILFHQPSVLWLLPLRLVRGLLRRPRSRLVMDTRTVHMPPREKEGMRGHLRRAFLAFMHHLANRWADGQTAITARMAEAVGIPSRQLWGIWPSGVTPDLFSPAIQNRTWPAANEPIHLIYLGTLHYERNLMSLCRAVAQANRAEMAFTLTLLGEGSEEADLAQFAQQTDGAIRVLPPVPHAQVPHWLAEAHVGVLPFPDEEKFRVSSPIKLFEYMAAGLPILATRIVCHTDVINDGNYVFWAEGPDVQSMVATLQGIWAERATLAERGKLAAATAPAWSWHATARKLADALAHRLPVTTDNRALPEVQKMSGQKAV